MSIYIGGRKVLKIYKDLDEVTSVYKGLDKVFGAGSPPGPTPTKVPLTYLQSDGTAYIDTGCRGTLNTTVVVKVTAISASSIGFFGDITNNAKGISMTLNFATGSSTANCRFDGTLVAAGHSSIITNRAFTVTSNSSRLQVSYSGGTANFNWDATPSSFTTEASMYLFALRTSSGVSSVRGTTRISECQITNANGGKNRHFYPYLIDGVPCMYDPENDDARYNIGPGAFVAGPAVDSLMSTLLGSNQNGSTLNDLNILLGEE